MSARGRNHRHAAAHAERRLYLDDPNRAPVNDYDAVRAVATEIMGIKYRAIPAPQTLGQLDSVLLTPVTDEQISLYKFQRKLVRNSWDILTERS